MIATIEQLLELYNVKTEEKLNWVHISINQKLSESFIERNSIKVYWEEISIHQKLSEEFITKHSDKVYWHYISIHQTLSKEFLLEHWEKIPVLSLVNENDRSKRLMFRLKESPNLIRIGFFKGTKEEAIEAIQEKYKDIPKTIQEYIDDVNKCFNTTLID